MDGNSRGALMIVFLDFDGVLHPAGCQVDKLFCRIELLEAWRRRQPTVSVVISSSWRARHPLDEMRSYFAEDLQNRSRGVTPQLSDFLSAAVQAAGAPSQDVDSLPQRKREWLRQPGGAWGLEGGAR